MPFDDPTRNELQKVVGKARDLLVEEFTSQCQRIYGIQPSGLTMDLGKLDHLPQEEQVRGGLLRDRIDHLAAGNAASDARSEAVARMVREQAFTVLNRLCALRMCEERGLVQECVRSGYESKGFRLYDQTASRLGGDTYDRYALFLQLVFDELSVDLGVLFDRFALTGLLFPGENSLKQALVLINTSELSHIWADDEAIGWVYQYFNSPEERRAMREASFAPRNSRELAVRNQFFTPRYVVEFLADNTLGRLWYEMRKGDTALKEDCRYLVEQPLEIFLPAGETPPAERSAVDISEEELLRKPVYIAHRPKKDPRDLRVLDPACGSGHFLLYAFDLLERIYEEAWADLECPASEVTGSALRDECETLDDLRKIAPRFIIEHNLHGIDIDPRAGQIAALALWLRAQKSWKSRGLRVAERPRIDRSNIVTAEPMPGEEAMRREFTGGLKPRVLGQLMDVVFKEMKLAGEAGSLLQIEEGIKNAIAEARRQWLDAPEPEQQLLFPGSRTTRPHQQAFRFDLTGVTNESFWHEAEGRTLAALKEYADVAESGQSITRRLFADDASHGFAFIDICSRRYDVVLMNPPFGDASLPSKPYIDETYGDTKGDVYKAFVECFQARLVPAGYLGIISSRTGFFLGQSEDWRTRVVLRLFRPIVLADLGTGVLDAMVEVAAYVLRSLSESEARELTLRLVPVLEILTLDGQKPFSIPKWQAARSGLKRHQAVSELERLEAAGLIKRCLGGTVRFKLVSTIGRSLSLPTETATPPLVCIRALGQNKQAVLANGTRGEAQGDVFVCSPSDFQRVPGVPFAYWVSPAVLRRFAELPRLEEGGRIARQGGVNGDDFRYLRCFWEVQTIIRQDSVWQWKSFAKGGKYSRFYCDLHLVVHWDTRRGTFAGFTGLPHRPLEKPASCREYFRPGLTWPLRTNGFSVRVLPKDCVFSHKGPSMFIEGDNRDLLLAYAALLNSSAFVGLVGLQLARVELAQSFEVGLIQNTPVPNIAVSDLQVLRTLAVGVWARKRTLDSVESTSHAFVRPAALEVYGESLHERARIWADRVRAHDEAVAAVQTEIDELAFRLYGFEDLDRVALASGLASKSSSDTESGEDLENEATADISTLTSDLLAYGVGCAFGHWDVRFATGERQIPDLPDPFAPLPVCPPGQLQNEQGLPLTQSDISSLQAAHGWQYLYDIPWNGILVDDPDNASDIVRRVREALTFAWRERTEAIEQESCEILGVRDLREYFRKPSRFFASHLKQYSKGRRQAPIYWPLSTASGSYTVWLYYPRLSDETLYTCVNDYVDPKLRDIERDLDRLHGVSSTNRASQPNIDDLVELQNELKVLRGHLLRIAALPYKPDQNDGVPISAAPLWELFRHRPWQAALRKCWMELNAGNYDWAGLAHAIWPDRVRKACSKDRSIAIAHGLENLYEG